jgi:hypothetical protein
MQMELLNLLHPLEKSYASAASIQQFIVELLHLSPMQRHRESPRLEVYIHELAMQENKKGKKHEAVPGTDDIFCSALLPS